ncbi:hypothetical protein GWK08_05950 [Leptobacterium flavescens]|uniref:Type II secretion system protein n=1 Tax=Leptobacterium flavescens TaxID=472055 RepID=A0A6P0UQ04_9FLAO|nr:hypothetical protein [Leptobacterium flavescens]NER12973.1 hypothetical protein [Leptobacterium flavescens]
MAVLRKIKASTLMETMVATVLIVIVFIIASLTLNNTFNNSISNNTHQIENYLHKLEYQYKNHLIKLPFEEEFGKWDILIEIEKEAGREIALIEAVNKETKKELKRKLRLEEER